MPRQRVFINKLCVSAYTTHEVGLGKVTAKAMTTKPTRPTCKYEMMD